MRLAADSIRLVSGKAETNAPQGRGFKPRPRLHTYCKCEAHCLRRGTPHLTLRGRRVKTPPFDPHNTAVDLARTLEDPQHGSESFRAEQEDDSPVLRGMRGRRIKTATTPPTLATHEVDRRFVEEAIRLGDPE